MRRCARKKNHGPIWRPSSFRVLCYHQKCLKPVTEMVFLIRAMQAKEEIRERREWKETIIRETKRTVFGFRAWRRLDYLRCIAKTVLRMRRLQGKRFIMLRQQRGLRRFRRVLSFNNRRCPPSSSGEALDTEVSVSRPTLAVVNQWSAPRMSY